MWSCLGKSWDSVCGGLDQLGIAPLNCNAESLFKPKRLSDISGFIGDSFTNFFDDGPGGRTIDPCGLDSNWLEFKSSHHFMIFVSLPDFCFCGCTTCSDCAVVHIGLAKCVYASGVPAESLALAEGL